MCQANTSRSFTSGGGFSNYYSTPPYQAKEVADYFVKAASIGRTPVPGYNVGRGYPDVTLTGLYYLVIYGGNTYAVGGTSASTPAVAAFFSNINAARMRLGKGSVGWVHPALYLNATLWANDVVSGNTCCAIPEVCCPQGDRKSVV